MDSTSQLPSDRPVTQPPIQPLRWGPKLKSLLPVIGLVLILPIIIGAVKIQQDLRSKAVDSINTATSPTSFYDSGQLLGTDTVSGDISVKDFGAKGDGTADDTEAIKNAIAAIPASGGIVYFPPGTYKTTSTIDLTGEKKNIWIKGAGPRASVIVTTVSDSAGINASSSSTKHNRISDLGLRVSDGSLPTAQRPGNYGIRNTNGVGYQLIIENVEILGFSNSGIYIEGATGPVSISNSSIQNNAGYGLEVIRSADQSPQDVRIQGGNIQFSWGGIHLNTAFSFHATDVDVELGTSAKYPALFVEGASYGNTFTDNTFSLGAVPTPAGVVVIEGMGTSIFGGENYTAKVAVDNIRFQGNNDHNTVIGGMYVNAGTNGSGFFVGGSPQNILVAHPILTRTYEANKDIVNDTKGYANRVTAIGVKTRSSASDADSASVSKLFSLGDITVSGGKSGLILSNSAGTIKKRVRLTDDGKSLVIEDP